MRKTVFARGLIVTYLIFTQLTAFPCGQGSGSTQIALLPTLGGSVFQVNALNSTGELTGFSYTTGDVSAHAFFKDGGSLVDLGTLGGSFSQGFAINNSGEIVGQADVGDGQSHAFRYTGTNLTDLGTLGGTYSSAVAINDAGQIVGTSSLEGDGAQAGFLYANGSMTNLGDLGGGNSYAAAINQGGTIVGDSWNADYEDHAFIYTNGTMSDLGTLGGNYSAAFGINDAGIIIGESSGADDQIHAFIYSLGAMTDLGTFGGTYSSPVAINNAGKVIGWATTPNEDAHGFICSGGSLTDLGTLGGTYANPAAINNFGQVVGGSGLSNDFSHAFIWQNQTMTDLNTFLPADSGWELLTARFINDAGRIVGVGIYNGSSRWFAMDLSGANNPPIAVADANTSVNCDQDAVLNATRSSDPDGDPLSYQWTEGSLVLGTNAIQTLSLPLGSHIITLTVTDPCGASSQTNVTVSVTDTTPPAISCPETITVSSDANCQANIPDLVSRMSAADNCAIASSLAISQNPAAGTVVGLGNYGIWLTVVDPSGNSNVCSTLFRVVDTAPPVIVSGPALAPVPAGPHCEGPVPAVTSQIIAADNCTAANALAISQNPVAGTPAGLGVNTIVVTVTDASGNATAGALSFTVVDMTAPSISSLSGPLTLSVGADCAAAVPDVLSSVVASDNCTPANALVVSQNPAAGSALALGNHTITVSVTDASGNTTAGSVPVSVVDTTAPKIMNLASSLTLSVSSNCAAAAPNVLSSVVATDNCTPANALVISQNPAAGTALGLGNHTITVTVTDLSGNTDSGTVSVSVVDTTAPKILNLAGPISLSVNSNCAATVPDVLSSVGATDNCTPANALVISQSPAAGTALGIGNHTITVTVTDASGNTTSGTVSVSVMDTTAPTIVNLSGPVTVSVSSNCGAPAPDVLSSVVATDNCTPANALVISQNPAAGTALGLGNNTITITVTDASGNSTSGTVSVLVVDTTAPTIVSAPGPLTVSLGSDCVAAVPNVLSSIVAQDNCTPASQLVISQSPSAGTLVGRGQQTITVTVTDASGNSATRAILLTVGDNTPPVVTSICATPNVLAPPNHQMVPVTISVVATGNCDGSLVSKIVSVSCNETPSLGEIAVTGPLTINLAASRDPSGSGRIYTIFVETAGSSTNVTTRMITVTVPKGNGNGGSNRPK